MGRTVMVVEDDPDNLDSLVDLLVDEGYEVLTARSGREACERLGRAEPCLVISDYLLPDMTGGDLLRRMREDRPDRPVPMIILTAVSGPAVAKLDAPVLTKPVTVEDLLNVLCRYCDPPSPSRVRAACP